MLKSGDVLVSTANSKALVGKSAMVIDTPEPTAFGAFVTVFRPREGVSHDWLALLLRSPRVLRGLSDLASNTTNISNLNVGAAMDMLVDAPAGEDQSVIAAKARAELSTAELCAQGARAISEDAAMLRSSVLRTAFGEHPPVSVAVGATSGPAWSRLLDLARLESGHTPSRRHPEWWGGPVPWLALPDIRKLHGKLAHETTETINDAGLANSSARLLPVGTVCVSRTASIGFVTMLGRPMATSQDFCNWVCDPERLDPEFLMYAFMASQESLRELGSGAVHKTIYMPAIQSFHVAAPAIAEQRRIARTLREQLAAAETLRTRLAERQAEIERLPQRILAAAFGEAD
jgi:type I restriction enzyme, S subunit